MYAFVYVRRLSTMTYDIAQALAMDALWTFTNLARQVRDDQLELPTPCAGWNLQTLLEHAAGQHLGITAALTGSGRDLAVWRPRAVGHNREALFSSIRDVRLALLSDLGDTAWMPELRPDAPFPTPVVLRAHLVDTVAHGWDVAASIGVPVDFSAPVVTAVYEVARQIPDGPERDQPGAAFAHALSAGDGPTLAGFLALLGRDIAWASPA